MVQSWIWIEPIHGSTCLMRWTGWLGAVSRFLQLISVNNYDVYNLQQKFVRFHAQ